MYKTLKVYLDKAGWGERIDVYIFDEKRKAIAESITMRTLTPEEKGTRKEPVFSLNISEGQHLMDQLWDCGLRPSEGSGSAGALKATQNHLEDMRALVFKTPKPKYV